MEHKPWAFILFSYNIGVADDIKAPLTFLRKVSGCDDNFIDHEGEWYNLCFQLLIPHYLAAATWGNFIKRIKRRKFMLHELYLDFMIFI